MPSLSAASTAQAATPGGGPGPSLAQGAGQVQRAPLAVTSHSLSLSTRAFSVDFSWSRVETQEPAGREAAPARAAAAAPAVQGGPARGQRAPQSFAEILRRQQLAQLLVVVPPTPRGAVLLLGAESPARALPGPVCRAYSQAQGPLAQSSLLYSA